MDISPKSRFLSRRKFMKKSGLAIALLAFSKPNLFAQTIDSSWAQTMELVIDFELKSRGKKPYVAVWIEDWAGDSVRTLHLWMQSRKGEKYLPDLKRWYRQERGGSKLIRAISSPTRRAGNYSVIWDGKNDVGTSLGEGEYYICVESARENGPYHLIRGRVTIAGSSFREIFKGSAELGDVQVELRKR